MSFNRENVTWQSANGTWNLGFYTVHESFGFGDDDDDYDSFEWVTTGHATKDAAQSSWKGSNPGAWRIVTYSAESDEHVAELDEMARRYVAVG